MPNDEEDAAPARHYVTTTRLEAFSDGVFAIAITLLVLDLSVGVPGPPLQRVLREWPALLAYAVSFLTIGGAWLAHTALTDRLDKADAILLRLNLLVLLVVSFLPFPTRLVAETLHDTSAERVYVAMYGITLLLIRVFAFVLDEYARRERLYVASAEADETDVARRAILPVVGGYVVAIGVGLLFPRLAMGVYAAIGIFLVVPFRELGRLLFGRT